MGKSGIKIIYVRIFKNWLAKEAFYKRKIQENLRELNALLKNIERNQAEIEILKRQTKETLKRVETAMIKFG